MTLIQMIGLILDFAKKYKARFIIREEENDKNI